MATSNAEFGRLLTEAIQRIKSQRAKKISAIQDELGHAIGRSGATIEHWRKGNLPARGWQTEKLVHLLAEETDLEQVWFSRFLKVAGYNRAEDLLERLFPLNDIKHNKRDSDQSPLVEQRRHDNAPAERPKTQNVERDVVQWPILPPEKSPMVQGFVGRQEQLFHYRYQLENKHLASISGMPGIGKSTLAATLINWLEWPQAKCFWYTFRGMEGIEDLIWRLADFLAWHGRSDFRQMLATDNAPPPLLLLDSILYTLSGSDYLLCFDDFHRAEQTDIANALWQACQPYLAAGSLKVMLISRQHPRVLGPTEIMSLTGLSLQETKELLYQHEVVLDDEQCATLYSLTQGNPQLLTLAIHMLQSGGGLAGLIEQIASTVSVEQYILHEIDSHISQDERSVMQAISALGDYPASKTCIESVAQKYNLTGLLNSLVVRNLVTTTGSNGSTLYSQHSMVQQFYYQSLGTAERDALHRRAGQYFRSSEADLLKAANHYAKANEVDETVALLTGENGLGLIRSGQSQAVMQLLDTLALEERIDLSVPELRLPINLIKATVHRTRGTFTEAQTLLEELAKEKCSDQDQAQIAYELGLIYSRQSQYLKALSAFQKVLDTPDAFVDHTGLARLHDSLGWAYRGIDEIDRARTHFEIGHQESIAADDLYTTCDTNLGLGLLDWQLGRLDEAEQRFTTSQALLEESGFVWAEANAFNNLALIYCEKEEFEQAIDYFDKAAELFERVGKIDGLIIVHNNLGELHFIIEAYGEAAQNFTQATTLARQTQNDLQICISCCGIATCMVAQGNLHDAETHILEAKKIAYKHEYLPRLGICYRVYGELCLQKGQREEAASYFSKSIPLLEIEQDAQEIELATQGLDRALG